MTSDSMNAPQRSAHSSQPNDAKEGENDRKPFVKPELRRETDLLDGTGTTVSWSGD